MKKNGFITLAFGEPIYIKMAKALAVSMRYYNPNICVAVVTDNPSEELSKLFDIVVDYNQKYGIGVSQKLHIDLYTPFEETVFIDSDCLLFDDPIKLWNYFKTDCGIGIMGTEYLCENDTHYSIKDLKSFLKQLNIKKMQYINTGIIYFNQSNTAKSIFKDAREIYENRNMLPFSKFKTAPLNDEPVFSAAMEKNNIQGVTWDEVNIMGFASGKTKHLSSLNVLKSKNTFIRDKLTCHPILIHFHVGSQSCFAYQREINCLLFKNKINSELISYFFRLHKTVLFILDNTIKNIFIYQIIQTIKKIMPENIYLKLRSYLKRYK